MFFYRILRILRLFIKNWEIKTQTKVLCADIKKLKGTVGKNAKFGYNVTISGLENINLGSNIYIGSGAFIRADGGLTIKDNTVISRNVVIYTNNHNYEGNKLPYDSDFINKPVIIEENVWIGMNVTIAPGTHIGEGAIIGIGARVFGKIPKYSIIGSGKCNIIKTRDKEHYLKLKK